MPISNAGKSLTASFEGLRLYAYPDPGTGGEPITIGLGHTGAAGPYRPRLGDFITLGRAVELFETALDTRYAPQVERAITRDRRQHVIDGFTCFHFNTGAIASGTVDDRWNRGDVAGAMAVLVSYRNAGGKVMAGLVTRRAVERRLIETGVYPAGRTIQVIDRPGARPRSIPASSLPWGQKAGGVVIDIAPAVPVPLPSPAPQGNFIVDLGKYLWSWVR